MASRKTAQTEKGGSAPIAHGTPKTAAEVKAWADSVEASSPYNNPEKRDWFAGECAGLGLKPASTTLCDFLEADDRASFGK